LIILERLLNKLIGHVFLLFLLHNIINHVYQALLQIKYK
jgi:hypothetical protein